MELIFLLIIAFVDLILGLLLISDNPRKRTNQLFSTFMLFALLWAIGDALMLFGRSEISTAWGVNLFSSAPLFIMLIVFYFAAVFPDDKPYLKNRLWYVVPAIPIVFAVITIALEPSKLIVVDTTGASAWHVQNQIEVTSNYKYYNLFFNVYFLMYGSLLIKKIHHFRKNKVISNRLKLFLISISTTTLFAFIPNLILPTYFEKTNLLWIGPLSAALFAALISYSIIRHRLFDIRLVVTRAVGYLLSIAVIGLLYSSIIFGLGASAFINIDNISIQQRIFFGALAFVVAVTFKPVISFFNRYTRKIFYRDSYDTQQVLDEVGKIIVGNIDLHKIEKTSLEVLNAALKTSYLGFILKARTGIATQDFLGSRPEFDDIALEKSLNTVGKKELVYDELEQSSEKAQTLRKNDISLVIPLITKNETIGYLVSGPKKSGNIFNQQDRSMLNIVANELAVALQNAQRFEEIQAFNITLQEKVDEATKELKKTNKKLVELDEAKDEFISMASHQLRTPLTSIKGYLSMLMEGDLGKVSKQQDQALKEAFTSSQRMVFLISDFLNVSRIKTGKFVIEPKEINLSDMVSEQLVQLREMAEAKELKMVYEPPADFPAVKLDENKMHQVMMNMIDNAIYYTPNKGTITIQLYVDGKDVVFKVIDTGIGVPKAEQHKLFTKFFRAGNARKTRPDGTGLGLFMAQKVVVAQGGSIIFESEEGKGSTFGFRFNLKDIKA